jgi:hypothetical protein
LLASKGDDQIFGQTEYEVRDLVHRTGAKAIQAALEGRKKGGYQGSSLSCPDCRAATGGAGGDGARRTVDRAE